MSLYKSFSSFLHSRKLEQDLEDELHSHIEMYVAERVEAGMGDCPRAGDIAACVKFFWSLKFLWHLFCSLLRG